MHEMYTRIYHYDDRGSAPARFSGPVHVAYDALQRQMWSKKRNFLDTDLRILINHVAERTTATAATIAISVTIPDA